MREEAKSKRWITREIFSELNLMNLIQSSKDDLKGAIMGLRGKNPATGQSQAVKDLSYLSRAWALLTGNSGSCLRFSSRGAACSEKCCWKIPLTEKQERKGG